MRKFTITGFAAISILIALLALPAWGTGTAYLGEMVPWPMPASPIGGATFELRDSALEQIVWNDPISSNALFGLLPIGTGDDPGITIAVVQASQGPPLLIVDTDNDESLDDEVWLDNAVIHGVRKYGWLVTVLAEYGPSGNSTQTTFAPYRISLYAQHLYQLDAMQFFYAGFCHLRGVLQVGEDLHLIAITSLTSDARYSSVQELTVAVDVDLDGVLDATPYSHEVFNPGMPLVLPSGEYVVSRVSESGQLLELERIGPPADIPQRIARGLDAPRFVSSTLSGDAVNLEDFPTSAEATILLFLRLPSSCSSCGDATAAPAIAWFEEVYDFNNDLGTKVRLLVVISSETTPDASGFNTNWGTTLVDFIWDPAINEQYRRQTGLFVLDKDGRIVAMDEVWGTVKDSIPYYSIETLSGAAVRYVIEMILDM